MPENEEVISIAVVLLGVAAVFQVFDGVQVAVAGALRGLERYADSHDHQCHFVLGCWIECRIVTGVFRFDRGAAGLWWGLVVGLGAAAILLTIRFNRTTLGWLD